MLLPRDRHRAALVALLGIATLTYFTMESSAGHRGGLAELDGYYYYVYLRSLQMDGDIDLTNDYKEWGNPFQFGSTPSGHARNIFGIGPALLWAPFFLLAHLLALAGVKLGLPLSLDGMSRFHQLLTFYGSLLYGWLALVFCYQIARRVFGRENALWPALGAALAGPLPYYCLTWASYSHAQAAMASSLMVLLWLSWREAWTLRRWALFGASAGLLLLVRPACAPLLLLPLYAGGVALWPALRARDPRSLARRLGGPLLGAALTLVVFSPQIVAWGVLFGGFLLVPQGQSFMLWSESAWASTLFSPRNGLLTMAPLMAVALLGLACATRRIPRLAAPLLGVFAAVAFVNGAVYDWWGWGFSARRYTACLPIFTFGLAAALQGARQWLAARPARGIAWGTALVIAGAISFNLQWMISFAKRNLDWYGIRSSEGLYMTVTHGMFKQVYSRVGNPLSLPSSLRFTLERGGDPLLYDRLSGSYLLGEFHPEANPADKPLLHATLDFGDLRFRPNLSDSFGYPERIEGIRHAPLRAPQAHVFLPINRPGGLELEISARALLPGTTVDLRFNGQEMGSQPLPTESWGTLTLRLPGRLVARGINRLDLFHHHPALPPVARCIGQTGVCTEASIAAVSGGEQAGSFAEVWVGGELAIGGGRGLNVAVVDPERGKLLDARFFDVVLYPAMFDELGRFLDRFPQGSAVALALRGDISRQWSSRAAAAFARLGASGQGTRQQSKGYVALGVLGAAPATALEVAELTEHARVAVGVPPPPWRVLARYRAIRLR